MGSCRLLLFEKRSQKPCIHSLTSTSVIIIVLSSPQCSALVNAPTSRWHGPPQVDPDPDVHVEQHDAALCLQTSSP
jgi:hypothetical protein